MFQLVVTLIMMTASLSGAQEPSGDSCATADRFIPYTANNIKNYYLLGDVTYWVQNLDHYMKVCDINPAQYGWGSGVLKYWQETGFKSEQKAIRDRLTRQAAVGKVDDKDRALLKKLEGIMKVPSADTTAFLTSQLGEAKKNQGSCEPQDLRNDKLGPVHDQGQLGWCYAFTAADLLSYKLGEKVSAADIATTYSDGWKKDVRKFFGAKETDFSAGWTKDAIEKMQSRGGVCRENDFASDSIEGTSLEAALNAMENKKARYKNSDSVCGEDMAAASQFLPNLRPQEYIDILRSSSTADYVKELKNKSCANRVDLSKIKIEKQRADTKDLRSQKALLDSIDKQLDEKNIVEMGYWAESYMNPHADRMSERSSGHSSLVVGRRFNKKTQSCEYLVRNTWGKDFKTPREFDNDQGNFWIPKEDLIKEIGAITYLK